jgi:mannose-6-phosphate isomerase
MNPAYDPQQFDAKSFSQLPYARQIEKPWGWELHWTPDNLPYMGKILHVNAGKRLSLQAHDLKQESWMLLSGQAMLIWENDQGELTETELQPGQGYSCALGQRHRLAGITDCDVLEVSTPEKGITWRLEDEYSRPDETEEQRAQERSQ